MKCKGGLSTSGTSQTLLAQSRDSLKGRDRQASFFGGGDGDGKAMTVTSRVLVYQCGALYMMANALLWIPNQTVAAWLADCFIQFLGLLLANNKTYCHRPMESVLRPKRAKRRVTFCFRFQSWVFTKASRPGFKYLLGAWFCYDKAVWLFLELKTKQKKQQKLNSHTEDRFSWLNISLSEVKRRD